LQFVYDVDFEKSEGKKDWLQHIIGLPVRRTHYTRDDSKLKPVTHVR